MEKAKESAKAEKGKKAEKAKKEISLLGWLSKNQPNPVSFNKMLAKLEDRDDYNLLRNEKDLDKLYKEVNK